MRKSTKYVAYILSLFFFISGLINLNLLMIVISIAYFVFAYFNHGCLKQNCSLDDSQI